MKRVAIIGAGHWGPNLIRCFHEHERCEVAWVVDADPSRLELASERFPQVSTTGSYEEALRDPAVDMAVIATPTTTHFDIAKLALEQGKHVLVEKPICRDSQQGATLCELAAAKERVLMVGHVFLYNGGIRWIKEYLEQGALGRVFTISMVRTNLGPIRLDVNAAWDLAAHDVSIVDYWLGSTPLSVSAVGGNWINPGIQDVVFATLRYPDDVLVNLHASWLNPRKTREITVVGDRRMLTFDDTDPERPIVVYDKRVSDDRSSPAFIDSLETFRAAIQDGETTSPRVDAPSPLAVECAAFVESVESGRAPLSDGRFGVAVARTLEALDRSMRNRGQEEPVRT